MTDDTATVGAFGQALMARLDTPAEFTDEPGILTRLFLSPARPAAAQVRDWIGRHVGIDRCRRHRRRPL